MKRPWMLPAGLLVLALTLAAVNVAAEARTPTPTQVLRAARAMVVVPMEWDGVWNTVDSTYDCQGAFDFVDGSVDTICGGKDYTSGLGGPFMFDCNGTATSTTFQQTCTGNGEVFPGCVATYTLELNGTRSGDTYFMVSTLSVSYAGSGTGCEFLPPTCTQTNSHGTRTGPAPPAYCAIPVVRPTWGRLKSYYR